MSRAYQGPGRMLLCIDDSRAILECEKTLFERSGYIVVTTVSPHQGLRLAQMTNFDALFLDYQMPGMNGHQPAQEIRRHGRKRRLSCSPAMPSFQTRPWSWSMPPSPKRKPLANCYRPSLAFGTRLPQPP